MSQTTTPRIPKKPVIYYYLDSITLELLGSRFKAPKRIVFDK